LESVPAQFDKVINVLTAHAVSPEGLVNNREICDPQFGHGLEPKIFWIRRSGKGLQREKRKAVLQTLNLMGDWCRQDRHRQPKETTAKGEALVTR